MKSSGFDDPLVHIWGNKIIGIKKMDQVSLRMPQSGVACGRKALIFLMYVPNSTIELLGNSRCIVRRAIVHHDHFDIRVALLKDATNRLLQKSRLVVARHHSADQRPGISLHSAASVSAVAPAGAGKSQTYFASGAPCPERNVLHVAPAERKRFGHQRCTELLESIFGNAPER